MRIVPTLFVAMVLLMTVPAIASATHGRSGTVIKKEQITVYTSHNPGYHDRYRNDYRQPGNNPYRHSNKHVRQPPRQAPAYGYHKKHSRPAPDKYYRHRAPQTRSHGPVQGPSIIVRIGF